MPSCSSPPVVKKVTRPESPSTNLPTEYFDLSWWGFAFWWFVLLGVHGVASAYYAVFALFYWGFQDTFLGYTLDSYAISLPPENHHTISYVHILMSASHGMCMLWMICGSLWRRKLAFSPLPSQSSSTNAERPKPRYSSVKILDKLLTFAMQLTDRRGFFGVNSAFFHPILVTREMLETALQTGQAVRMSTFLPRMLLNRFYVVLLVMNCWSSILIYSPLMSRDEARRRFASIVCDCALDLMASVGVSIMVMLTYVEDYEPDWETFDWEKWSEDAWIAQVLNEAQIVLVVSWMDLASRVVFSLGLIVSTGNMKDLLRCRSSPKTPVVYAPTLELSDLNVVQSENTDPPLAPNENAATTTDVVVKSSGGRGAYSDTGVQSRCGVILLYTTHVAFALWGFVVLGMHVYASLQTPLLSCKPEVNPMAGAMPSCYKADINCYAMEMSANLQEMEEAFARFDRSSVRKLVVRHCPALELPDSLQDFVLLGEIRVYNSTIVDWAATASITNTSHPVLSSVWVSRVNMTDGLLPAGFQSDDFPIALMDLEFCVTNLRELPDDLDTKWNEGMTVQVEDSQLTVVPVGVARLKPFYFILTGNPIAEIPPELFEIDDMLYVGLGRTQVRELPRSVANPAWSPPFFVLTDTEISSFWSWVDPLVESLLIYGPMFMVGGSPYCAELDAILVGEAENFSVAASNEYSSILMNASESNFELLFQAVDCAPAYGDTYFPLDFQDAVHAIT